MVASIGHYIDNKAVAGKSGRTGDVTNPATGDFRPARGSLAVDGGTASTAAATDFDGNARTIGSAPDSSGGR